jgi:hypothetical protein
MNKFFFTILTFCFVSCKSEDYLPLAITVSDIASQNCAVPLKPRVMPLPYVAVGGTGLISGTVLPFCPTDKPCNATSVGLKFCTPSPASSITILGVRADGFVGQIRHFNGEQDDCPDHQAVWVSYGVFQRDDTWRLAAGFFPKNCSQ